MAADRVDAQANHLGIALAKFFLQAGYAPQFRGANRGEVFGVRKKNGPTVADPLMKADRTLGRFGSKIWSCVIDSEGHAAFPAFWLCRLNHNFSRQNAADASSRQAVKRSGLEPEHL